MKATIISVLAIASTALAWGPAVSQISDGQPQAPTDTAWASETAAVWSTAAAMTTWSTTAPVVMSTPPAPYPVPGGNSTMAATGTAPVTKAAPTTWETSAAPTAPAPSAPVATNAAAALQIGGAAVVAGLFAFLA